MRLQQLGPLGGLSFRPVAAGRTCLFKSQPRLVRLEIQSTSLCVWFPVARIFVTTEVESFATPGIDVWSEYQYSRDKACGVRCCCFVYDLDAPVLHVGTFVSPPLSLLTWRQIGKPTYAELHVQSSAHRSWAGPGLLESRAVSGMDVVF